jgi:FkbH-like protein
MEAYEFKKAIIFDCDNVLWRGIVGEGPIEHNTALQQDIVMFARRGVIIGLCSKNNEADVATSLDGQPLTDEFIAVKRINWLDKATNLASIVQELNIGIDSIVFVDDSPFELGLIRNALPAVLAILPEELDSAVSRWFNLSGDLTKTQQYKENRQRAQAQVQFQDIEAYLASLEMVLTIKRNDKTSTERVAELTQKTNQFNLTTKRYTVEQINNFMSWMPTHYVYTLAVRDKFGNSGLTGVCIITGCVIDTFLLSCRIIGRNIEYAFLDYIINDLERHNNYAALIGKFVDKDKNIQTKDFYSRCGFKNVNTTDDVTTFTLRFDDYNLKVPKYFIYE